MDTNVVAQIVQLIAANRVVPSIWENPAIITSIAALIAAIGAWISSQSNKSKIDDAKKVVTDSAVVIQKIHTDVNSGRTAMVEAHKQVVERLDQTIKELNARNLEVSKELAEKHGEQKGQQQAPALQQAAPSEPMKVEIVKLPPLPLGVKK